MQSHPRPSNEIAEAMLMRAQYDHMRRTSIYRSLYAPALAVVNAPSDHPGYEDVILTRSHRSAPMSAHRLAWLDFLMGREVQS